MFECTWYLVVIGRVEKMASPENYSNRKDSKPLIFLYADQVLRDEFACPITCELIHDPVIAADGHSVRRVLLFLYGII